MFMVDQPKTVDNRNWEIMMGFSAVERGASERKELFITKELTRDYVKLALAEGLLWHFKFLNFVLSIYRRYLKYKFTRKLESSYEAYSQDSLFRNAMVSTFMEILEEIPEVEKEDLIKFLESLNLKKEIEQLVIEDIEEAVENLSLKRHLGANEERLKRAIEKFNEKINSLSAL